LKVFRTYVAQTDAIKVIRGRRRREEKEKETEEEEEEEGAPLLQKFKPIGPRSTKTINCDNLPLSSITTRAVVAHDFASNTRTFWKEPM